jgi:type 1 glutamine amidotransferase
VSESAKPLSRAALMIGGLLLLTALAAAEELPKDAKQRIEEAVPKQAPTVPKQPRRLLVVTLNVRDGKTRPGHPSIPYGNRAIDLMGRRTGAYTALFSNDVSMFRPERLKEFDAVCFNNTVGVLFDDPALRRSLLDFVSGGKGFVGIHAAAATFVQWPRYDQWPEFGAMLGGYEDGGHPWKPHETITLELDEPDHPINRAFGGKGFQISDEVFQFRHGYSRDRVRVLLSVDTDRTDMSPSRRFLPERFEDKDFPISWIRFHGEGRVFYSALGHNPHIFWNRPVLEHFLAGIQFALGDLDADAAPSTRPVQTE